MVVPIADGSLQLCNDFQNLNEVSKFNGNPMLQVDKLMECLGRARFMSTLDLTKAYWQRPPFALPQGVPGSPVWPPQSTSNIPVIDGHCHPPHHTYTTAYMDNVIIHSSTWQDHLYHLCHVLEELWKVGLIMNPQKCNLWLTKVQYLEKKKER